MIGLALVVIILNGGPAWGQLSRFFIVQDHTVSFDTQCNGTECRQVLFLNVGNRSVTIKELTLPPEPFSLDASTSITTPLVLNPGDTLRGLFCYRPTVPGAVDAGQVVLTVDTGSATDLAFDTVLLDGISRSPKLEIDPPTVNFGDVTIGSESCVTITIRNTGNDSIDLSTLRSLNFPFVPATVPEGTLAPGKDIQVQICFSPITTQEFHDTLAVKNGGCHQDATLSVEGKGLKVTTNIGPVLQIVSVEFDTAMCGSQKCRTLTIRNIGTDPMQVAQVDPILPPFSGSISPSPITVPANEERTFTICYSPESVPQQDSATIHLLADNRVPLSIAAVFDVSGSMNTPFGNFGSNRIAAANAAGQSFLGNLVNDPTRGVVDEGAVYRFGDIQDFLRIEDYSTDLTLLQSAVPDVAFADFTCIYDAVIRVSAELETRNIKGRRVMVLLTDGANSCDDAAGMLSNAITAAQDGGIRIYTIGIGSVDAGEMTQLAQATGGFFSEALNPGDLLESYQRIANDLSKNQPASFTIKGRSVAPDLEVSATELQFDSVRIGNNRCRSVTLRNTGDASLAITSLTHPSAHFVVSPSVIPEIAPGDSVVVQVCFMPGRLRRIDSVITFNYTHCVPESRSITLSGTGYDSVVVEMTGDFIARPGSVVTVPVHLYGRIPAAYGVDSLELVFGYNKTVLFPETPSAPLNLTNTPAATMVEQQATPLYDPQNATLTVKLAGGQLNSTRSDTLLAELNLMALHGNALTTPIELKGAIFADGNPKVGIRTNTSFLADSLCFQEDRLIDASARFGPTMKLVRQEGNRVVIRITLPTDGHARSDLFDQLGEHVGIVFDETKSAGEYETTVDLSRVPTGSYWLRLLLNGAQQVVMNVMVRN